MTTDYRVVVPSYQRPDQVAGHTLRLLAERRVPMSAVTVFLHRTDPRLGEYVGTLDMLGVDYVVTEAVGINAQRRAMVDHYPEGTRLVGMDDDIEDVITSSGPRWADVYSVPDLDALFRDQFQRCADSGLYVWGTNPVNNPFFFFQYVNKPWTYDLKLVMFTMFGWLNRPSHPVHDYTVRYKDEQEFSLRTWWYDGGMVRNNQVGVKTKFYSEGGCQAAGRTVDQVLESIASLKDQWGDLVVDDTKRNKKSAWPEINLRRRARTEGHDVDTLPPGVVI